MLDRIFVQLKELIVGAASRYIHGSWLDLLSMIINMIAVLTFAPLLAYRDDADIAAAVDH